MSTFAVLFTGLICMLFLIGVGKNAISVSTTFVIMWTVFLGLATLGLYGIDKPSIEVIVLGCASMCIFSFFGAIKYQPITIRRGNKVPNQFRAISNNKLLIIANVISYIFSIPSWKGKGRGGWKSAGLLSCILP